MKKIIITIIFICVVVPCVQAGGRIHGPYKQFEEPIYLRVTQLTSACDEYGGHLKILKRGKLVRGLSLAMRDGHIEVKVEYGGFIFKDVGWVPAYVLREDK